MQTSTKTPVGLYKGDLVNLDYSVVSDPWDEPESEQLIDSESWLLGYVDMLTLMLTLVVLLLAYHQIQKTAPERTGIERTKVQRTSPAKAASGSIQSSESHTAKTSKLSTKKYSRAASHSLFPPSTRAIDSDFALSSITDNNADDTPILYELGTEPVDNIQMSLLDKLIAPLDGSLRLLKNAESINTKTLSEPLNTIDLLQQQSTTSFVQARISHVSSDHLASYQTIIADQGLSSFIDINQESGAIRLEVNESILFSIGSADLKPQGLSLLRELSEMFSKQPGLIHVEGHTDNVPIETEQYPSNWELSSGRATAVARYLIEQSVNPKRLRAIGFADTKPLAGNDTAIGRSKNRRVSLVITLTRS